MTSIRQVLIQIDDIVVASGELFASLPIHKLYQIYNTRTNCRSKPLFLLTDIKLSQGYLFFINIPNMLSFLMVRKADLDSKLTKIVDSV